MSGFTEGFWDLFIVLCTLGGIFGLWWFVAANARARPADPEHPESTGHLWDEDLRELNNPLPRWWLNLFYITLAFGVVYLFLYPGLGSNEMVLGWTQVEQYEEEMAAAEERYGPLFERYAATDIPALAADPRALGIGERLFSAYCASCHGADARGGPGFPDLADDKWLWGGDPADIERSILDGRQAIMPGWRAALGGEEGVRNVAQHVLGLSGREHDGAASEAGKAQYMKICVACHSADGTGNQALGAPDLTDSAWLYGGSLAAIEATIAEGRQGRMPAHREFLGEAKAHLLAAYVYRLSR